MTDPDITAFSVVDRRRSAQVSEAASGDASADAAPSSAFQPDVPADNASTRNGVNPAQTQEAQSAPTSSGTAGSASNTTADAFGEPDDDASGDDAMPMPDPGALLAYVAMQMDVKTLASALLGVFSGQAWQAMGLVASPVTGQIEKNLPDAQLAIDCVQFLLGKLDADLSAEERREIQRRLNDLRVNYLAKMREN